MLEEGSSSSSDTPSSPSHAADAPLEEEMHSEPSEQTDEQEEEFVCLVSIQNDKTYVNKKSLVKAEMIIEMLEKIGAGDDNEVPLKFSTETIQKIAEWLHKRYNKNVAKVLEMKPGAPTPKLPPWDQKFLADMKTHVLAEVLEASLFLHITELYTMASRHTANLIRGKSVDEVRAILDIQMDAEEKKTEDERQKHSAWCT